MKKNILLIYFCVQILGMQAQGTMFNSVALSWQPATNQVADSNFQVWVGCAASHNYSRHYPAATNEFVFTADMLDPGLNYVCVSQISTRQAEPAPNISGTNDSRLTRSGLDATEGSESEPNVPPTNNSGVTAFGPAIAAIDISAFSGEVQILKAQWVTVSPVVTNETIEVSTDLGQSWQCAGTNVLNVPVSEAAQRYFRARANFTVTITRTNLLSLPPAP